MNTKMDKEAGFLSVSLPAEDQERSLLQSQERGVPSCVLRVCDFLNQHGVWLRISRNHEARSCRDAARKRRRLGHEGIDLWDELKSLIGRFVNSAGCQQYVIAHCRADRQVNLARLGHAVDARELPGILQGAELNRLGLSYGLANPFLLTTTSTPVFDQPVVQVFDQELLEPGRLPDTVMTNAGDLTWAVEFDARTLIAQMEDAVVADIAVPDPKEISRPWGSLKPRAIGILTGNAPESGMALWEGINRHVRFLLGPHCMGDISMPPMEIRSMPELGLTMELASRHELVWHKLRAAVEEICGMGISFLSIACHTTHYFTPQVREICDRFGVEFVSVAETLADWLRSQGVRQLALVGIRYVADLGPWSAYREPLAEFEVEALSERAKGLLDDLAYRVKKEGAKEAGLNRLRDILRTEVDSDYVVLALTELSLLLARQRQESRSGRVLVDPLELYAEALARRFLSLPFPQMP